MTSLWLTWNELNRRLEDRPLVYFGAGHRMRRTAKYIAETPDYYVDNNPYAQDGVRTCSPECLEEQPRPFVVITTVGFLDVKAQLESYGYKEGVDFCVSPVLRDFAVLERIANHKARVLFTCSDPYNRGDKRGGLYELKIPSGKVTQLRGGHCHGLARGPVGCLALVNDTAGGVEILSRHMERINFIELPPDARPHGVAVEGEWIAVAFSGLDQVALYKNFSLHEMGYVSNKFECAGLPAHHVNDICIADGILYISMFSHSGNWKRGVFDGVILEHRLGERDAFYSVPPVIEGLSLPHTPRVIDGILHFCESMEGRVWKGSKVLATFTGFVRGIDYDEQFYYVGQSQHRHITRRLGADNISLDTGIFILDAETKCTRFYPTPGLTDINAVMVRP